MKKERKRREREKEKTKENEIVLKLDKWERNTTRIR